MWAKVDDGFWCHPKVMGVPLAARGLWVSALSWSCHQRSPVVPSHFLAMVGATLEDVRPLVAAGLWTERDGGWEIHQWSEYQELSTSEKRAAAGRRGGQRSGEARRSKPKQTDTTTRDDAPKAVKQTEARPEAGPIPSQPTPTHPQNNACILSTTEVVGGVDPEPAVVLGFAAPKPPVLGELRAKLKGVPGEGTHAGESGPGDAVGGAPSVGEVAS